MLGIAEILVILVVLLGAIASGVGVVFFAIWLSKRLAPAAAPPSAAKPAACPRCGTALPADAPQGLCPRCVLQVGIGTEDASEPAFRDASGKPNPPDPAELAKHFPQLEILELLGQGGMGAVYKARQKDLDRFVALKVLPGGAGGDPAFAERFSREARALAKLNHPNIVAVHDFGQVDRGTGFQPVSATGERTATQNTDRRSVPLYYFIMEFIDGPNLRQLMQTRRIEPREALSIVPSICEALQFAHDEGIVHRDIKPENILLDKKGRVKIADFGIAKIVIKGRDATLTGAKDVIGTPHYMAPEQVERPAEVDHRADIYSLGVVFYEMLTGELPLGKFEVPSRKVQVDVRLDEVVLHSLEKEPARRYQHASEIKTDVETIATGGAQSECRMQNAEVEQRGQEWERRGQHPVAAALALVACVLLWGLLGFATYVMPMIVERFASQDQELPVIARLIFQVGSVAHHWDVVLVPLLVLATAGSLVWLFLSPKRPARQPLLPPRQDGKEAAAGSRTLALRVAQWTARILGTLLLLFYGTFIVAEGLPPIATQSVGVQLNFIALGLMLGGFAVGWKREGTAAILITSGWTLWHISEGRLDLNLFQTPLPVAALYGYCWWELRGRRTGVLAGTVAVLAVTLGLGRLLLPVNVFVHGVVTDATTGTPITNASLAIIQKAATDRESNELPNARTGITGRFRLHLGWYVAQQPVRIAAPGYSVLTTNLGPRALGARNVSRDFLMQPTGQSGDAGIRLPGPVPPVVLSTVPASGSRDVDPTLTELRVTFSKPMLDGHWAWCTLNDGSYPETTGASRFLNDERTCVLPVKLEPGRVYATWVNVDKFQGFKDQNGTPAVPYLLIFETRK